MFAQKKVTLPKGRHKIIILDEADRWLSILSLALISTRFLRAKLCGCFLSSLYKNQVQWESVLLLLFVNMFAGFSEKQKRTISTFLIGGILLFSGSIYAIYLGGVPAKSIWFITPLGGVLLIVGWILLCLRFVEKVIKKE